MRLDIISIFPEYFAPLDVSLLGKARRRGLVDVHVHDLRQWAHDRHRTVDDTPYGGGPGMVMKPDPWGEALDTIAPPHPPDAEPSAVPPPESRPPADHSHEAQPSKARPAPPQPAADAPYEGISPAAGSYEGQPAPAQPAKGRSPEGEPSGGRPSEALPSAGERSGRPSEVRLSVDRPTDSLPSGGRLAEGRPYEGQASGGGRAQAPAGGPYGGAESGEAGPRLIVLTPSGRPFTQAMAVELAAEPWLIFACGRYEGIDSRVVEEARTRMRVDEVSIGDYVLAGGEVAALVMIEAISRLLPGVLGNADSVSDDSFAPGTMESLLEGPVYTKPPVWRDRAVPEVLLSGHHGAIARWRRDQALRRTAANRPELAAGLDPAALDTHDRDVLRDAGPGPAPVDGES